MLNHVKKGLERTYDRYELEDEKRASFLKWETKVAEIARRAWVADALGVPASPMNAGSPGRTRTYGPHDPPTASEPGPPSADAAAPRIPVIRLAGTVTFASAGYGNLMKAGPFNTRDAGSRSPEDSWP